MVFVGSGTVYLSMTPVEKFRVYILPTITNVGGLAKAGVYNVCYEDEPLSYAAVIALLDSGKVPVLCKA